MTRQKSFYYGGGENSISRGLESCLHFRSCIIKNKFHRYPTFHFDSCDYDIIRHLVCALDSLPSRLPPLLVVLCCLMWCSAKFSPLFHATDCRLKLYRNMVADGLIAGYVALFPPPKLA